MFYLSMVQLSWSSIDNNNPHLAQNKYLLENVFIFTSNLLLTDYLLAGKNFHRNPHTQMISSVLIAISHIYF